MEIGLGPDSHGFIALVTTVIWMGLGILVYYGYSEPKEQEKIEAETPTIATEQPPEPERKARDQRLLVPIANPDSVDRLMRTALDLAEERNAEVEVMSVVTVPQQTPLSEGQQFVSDERTVLEEAIDFADETHPDIPVSGRIRISHNVSEAILNTVRQDDVDLVVMGWRGRGRRRDYVLGSNVDEVVTKARCDVLVERIGPATDVESILVPTAGGPHAEFAAEIARAIALANDARVEVIYISEADEDDALARDRLDRTAEILRDVDVETVTIESDEVVDTIVDRSSTHDITVVGSSREGLLQQLVFGAIPEEVGRRAENTVIMAKRYLGLRSRVTRWFKSRRD